MEYLARFCIVLQPGGASGLENVRSFIHSNGPRITEASDPPAQSDLPKSDIIPFQLN